METNIVACPACSAQNEDTNRYCTGCGQALNESVASPTLAPTPPQAKKVCQGCRTINEAASLYCYRCGLSLPDQLHTESEVIGNPAGFWLRAGAYFLDSVLIWTVGLVAAVSLFGIEAEQAINELVGASPGWTTTILITALDVTYYTITVGLWGQTLGKALLGLKVTRSDGSPLTYTRSFARFWAYSLSYIPFGLGFIAIALSSQKRGWHDFVCDTRVVQVRGL